MSFLIGIVTGIFGGIAGVGGGAVMIPLMVAVMKVSQHKAHGTSLTALVFTGIAGSVSYGMNGSVDIMAACLLVASAVFTAGAGARFCHSLDEAKLKKYFGIFIIVVSAFLLLKPYIPHPEGPLSGWPKVIILLGTGIIAGFQSGMMGGGGGVIMIPSLVLLAGYSQHLAQGTSLVVMIPVGIIGAVTYMRRGLVDVGLLKGLVPGILIGVYGGASFAHLLPDDYLRVLFIVIIGILGIRSFRAGLASTCVERPG